MAIAFQSEMTVGSFARAVVVAVAVDAAPRHVTNKTATQTMSRRRLRV
jgi:hypothetical protein